MNRKTVLLNKFLKGLSLAAAAQAIFAVSMSLSLGDNRSATLSWLLYAPLGLFFICGEWPKSPRVAGFSQMLALAACSGGAYLAFGFSAEGLALMLGAAAVAVQSFFSGRKNRGNAVSKGALGVVIASAAVTSLSKDYGGEALNLVLITDCFVCLVCERVCQYFQNLHNMAETRWWPRQSRAVAERFTRRSLALAVVMTGAAGAVIALCVVFMPSVGLGKGSLVFGLNFEWNKKPMEIMDLSTVTEGDSDAVTPPYDMGDIIGLLEDGPAKMEDKPAKMEDQDTLERVSVALAAAIALAAAAAALLLRDRSRKDGALQELEEEITEAPAPKRRRIRRGHKAQEGNPVRAAFRRKVNEHRQQGLTLQTADTAMTITARINETEDIGELSERYHEARYSGRQG